MKKVPFDPLEPTPWKMVVFYFCSLEQTKHEQPSQPMPAIIFLAKHQRCSRVLKTFFFAIEKITEII